jgi:hypothetical protein
VNDTVKRGRRRRQPERRRRRWEGHEGGRNLEEGDGKAATVAGIEKGMEDDGQNHIKLFFNLSLSFKSNG